MPSQREKDRNKALAAAAVGSGTAAGGAAAHWRGILREEDASAARFRAGLQRGQVANKASEYERARREEVARAAKTTRPEQQKVDPKVVGGTKRVARHERPAFRPDLVPHGKETKSLGEAMQSSFKDYKKTASSAAKLGRSATRLQRGGIAATAAGASLAMAAPGIAEGNKKSKRKVSKANPVKAVVTGARGHVAQSRSTYPTGEVLLTRSRTGGWALKPKTSVTTTSSGGKKTSKLVIGGGLTDTGKTVAVVGGAAGAGGAAYAHDRRYVKRKPETKTVKVKVKKGHGMGVSAFGVAHPSEVSKAEKRKGVRVLTGSDASTGRHVTAQIGGPIHGLVAGRKGKKLRAAGNQWAGGIGGSLAGGVAAGALTRGRFATTGAFAGGVAGTAAGTNRAQNKGHFKRQKVSKSAFGVEHEVEKAFSGANALRSGVKRMAAGNFSGGAKSMGIGAQQAGRAAGQQVKTTLKPIGTKTQNTWNKMNTAGKVATVAGGGALAAGGVGYGMNRRRGY